MKTQKSSGMVLFREKELGREYIVLQYNLKNKYWGLTKGGIEEGETEKQAALREANEETSLSSIEVFKEFKEKISYYLTIEGETYFKEVTFFLGKVSDNHNGKISQEHHQLVWLPFNKALELITFEKDRNLLIKAEDFLNSNITKIN